MPFTEYVEMAGLDPPFPCLRSEVVHDICFFVTTLLTPCEA